MRRLGFALAVIATVPAVGVAEVDQSQLDGSDQARAIHSTNSAGQTVTVGVGGILTGIELSLGSSAVGFSDLVVQVVDASGGIVDPPVLAEAHVGEADLGQQPLTLSVSAITATLIDLGGFGVSVAPGEVIGFSLTTDAVAPSVYSVRAALSDLYAGGEYYSNGVLQPTNDCAFKTFVEQLRYPADVDQYQLHGWDQSLAIHSLSSMGQTFTVDLARRLDAVELILAGGGEGVPDLVVEVLDASGGVAGAPVLGGVLVGPGALGGNPGNLDLRAVTATRIGLSSLGIKVQPGDVLGIRLSTTAVLPDLYSVRVARTNRYPGGSFFSGDIIQESTELAFKTFVNTIFADGFESGGTGAWTAVVPRRDRIRHTARSIAAISRWSEWPAGPVRHPRPSSWTGLRDGP